METRILTSNDSDSIKEVIESRTNLLGIDQQSLKKMRQQAHLSTINLLALSDRGHQIGRIIGAFSDNRLDGVLLTAVSSEQPCWYAIRMHTRKGISNGISALGAMMDKAVTLYEADGFRRFYAMYPARHVKGYQYLRRAMTVASYISYVDLEIPALTRPKFTDFWEILCGRTLYTEDMVVRGFVKVIDTNAFM
jgi:hypothetical protein